MIDSHAHFNSKTLDNLEEIEQANKIDSIKKIINVGLDYETSEETIKLSLKEDEFYSAIGIHPLYEGSIEEIYNLYYKYDNRKIVAIGETGLDISGNRNEQIKKFIESIALANLLKLPIIIHANNTNKEVLEILKQYRPLYGYVLHCYQPEIQYLEEIVSMDGYISLSNPILRVNAKKSIEVIKKVEISNLLIETDYPYMVKDYNTELYLILKKVCEVRQIEENSLIDIIDNNTKRLFKKL